MYKTKLGPHLIVSGGDGARIAREAKPTIVKIVDGGFEFANELTVPDRPLIIGRITEKVFDPNRTEFKDQPTMGVARWYVDTFLARPMRQFPAVDAWEVANECVITDSMVMRWFARFLAEAARILREEFNRTAVLGNWAVGNPDYPLWSEYVSALDAVRKYGAMLGRHNYAGPDQSTWGYLLLRHRQDNQAFGALGYPDLPVVITEAGADSVPFGNPPGQAWKSLFGGDAVRYWNEILLPLDGELRKDHYVRGAVVFTCGQGWPEHNIDGTHISQWLIDYAKNAPPITFGATGGTTAPLPPTAPLPTHRVTASILNVRGHPWTGTVTPALVGQLMNGTRIRVEGWIKFGSMQYGWALISPHGEKWVNGKYLAEIR